MDSSKKKRFHSLIKGEVQRGGARGAGGARGEPERRGAGRGRRGARAAEEEPEERPAPPGTPSPHRRDLGWILHW